MMHTVSDFGMFPAAFSQHALIVTRLKPVGCIIYASNAWLFHKFNESRSTPVFEWPAICAAVSIV